MLVTAGPLAGERPCPDCGALFPDVDGPVHAYVGGSPGCWAAFGRLGARELALGIPGPERLSVHAYMVQHPGREGRREAQSVDVHLMVLAAVIELGWPVTRAVGQMDRWLRDLSPMPWLPPPRDPRARTILSLDPDADAAAHEAEVLAWARDVWAAWAPQHARIVGWLESGRPA